MATEINALLREIHRLRKHLRDIKSEIDNLPRVKKAHLAKVAKQEAALKEMQDQVKHAKSTNNEREVSLKATHTQLQKYERQLNDMKSPKEVEGKQLEIKTAKTHIDELEEQILLGIGEIEEKVARVPAFEEQLKRVRAEFATFEADFKDREARLHDEFKSAGEQLAVADPQIPQAMRPLYDRLIKAHGADTLAMVKEKDRICSNCLTAVTVQSINELHKGMLTSCPSCGRIIYLDHT